MANIAIGKLPLEKVWKRPEEATDGISIGYTSEKGFAEAGHPCNFTLDLGLLVNIHTIRFLLWDGLGQNIAGRGRHKRQYYYELLLSKDSKTWESYYQTTERGFNGWQVFEFAKITEARFVRLFCKHNTENAGFHIVEFEVHNAVPKPLSPNAEVVKEQLLFEPVAKPNQLCTCIIYTFSDSFCLLHTSKAN